MWNAFHGEENDKIGAAEESNIPPLLDKSILEEPKELFLSLDAPSEAVPDAVQA